MPDGLGPNTPDAIGKVYEEEWMGLDNKGLSMWVEDHLLGGTRGRRVAMPDNEASRGFDSLCTI